MYARVFEFKERNKHSVNSVMNEVHVNGNSELFIEHFEDYPIVPGAFSLCLCISEIVDCINKELGRSLVFKSIRKVRFNKPVLPHTDIKILMKKYTQTNSEVVANFELTNDDSTLLVDGCIELGERYE